MTSETKKAVRGLTKKFKNIDLETLNDNSPLRNQDDEGYFNNLIDRDSKEEMKKRREENSRENERMEKEISRRRMNISNQEIIQKVYLIWEEKCKKRKRISSKDREDALNRIIKDIKEQEKYNKEMNYLKLNKPNIKTQA